MRRGGLPGGGRGINREDSWSGTSVGLMGLGILLLLDRGPEEEDRERGSSTCQSDPREPVGKVNLSRSNAEGKCSHDSDRDGESGAGKPLRVGESGSRIGMRLVRGDSSRGDSSRGDAGAASALCPVVSPWLGVEGGPPSGQPESLSTSLSEALTETMFSSALLGRLEGEIADPWSCSVSTGPDGLSG